MNERDKELAEQAGILYREIEDEFVSPNKDGVNAEAMIRFASLVRIDEQQRLNNVLRQLVDAGALSSSPRGLRVKETNV